MGISTVTVFWLAIGGIGVGFLLCLALIETAPAVLRRRGLAAAH